MENIKIHDYKSVCGELMLGSYNEKLCLCDWKYRKKRASVDARIQKGLQAAYEVAESDVVNKAIAQLDEYFRKERTLFDIPLLFIGTDFQQKVWNALLDVPYGQTETYAELSKRIGSPSAIRAVASANGANSLSLFVPCHRIMGSKGELVGYAGGLAAKQRLASIESANLHKEPSLFNNV